MPHKISPSLKLEDVGDKVVNLQEALRLLIEREKLIFDDPADKDRKLRALLSERRRSVFGDGTLQLVQLFQERHNVEVTGEVDQTTADLLNNLLREIGALNGPDENQFVVKGQVQMNGRAAIGMTVRAFDKDLRAEEKLDEDTTNEQGRYKISYTPAKFGRAERANADLRVAVFEGERQLISSDIQFNAPPEITINLVLPSSDSEPSEYERYLTTLEPVLQGLSLAELKEDEEHQDITFLAGETEIARDHVTWLIESARLAGQSEQVDSRVGPTVSRAGIPAEAFYGWLRQQLPPSLEELVTLGEGVLRKALDESVRDQIIPALDTDTVEKILAQIHDLAIRRALQPSAEDAPVTLGNLFASILSTDKQITLTSAYLRQVGDISERRRAEEDTASVAMVENSGGLESLWRELTNSGFTPDEVRRTQDILTLDRLTDSHAPLIQELIRQTQQQPLLSLAQFDEKDWANLLKSPRNPDDPNSASIGAPSRYENIDSYARKLNETIETIFPTQVLANRIARDDDSGGPFSTNKADLTAFFSHNPEFVLGAQPLDQYLSENIDKKFEGVSHVDETRAKLKQMERITKFAPGFTAMRALLADNIDSAFAAQLLGKSAFKKRYGRFFGGDAGATYIYNKTNDIALRTLSLYLKFGFLAHAPSPYVLKANDGGAVEVSQLSTAERATWKTMFGALESCACQHCQSLTSPAAYLVDLLAFLRQNADNGSNPLDVLLTRRPDLAQLELTCDNTNIQLPYVDLVNEILERAITGPMEILADLSATDLDAGIIANEIKDALSLTAQAQLSTERVGQSWTIRDPGSRFLLNMNEQRTGVLVRSLPQTTEPQPSLAANPQHLHGPAYEVLAKAGYPWSLPFHLPLEQARSYLHELGIERHQVMAAFQVPDEVLSNDSIAIELLRMSLTEARIITGSIGRDPAKGNGPTDSPWTFWGFDDPNVFMPDPENDGVLLTGPWNVLLKRVALLLAQSGMKYVDLLEVLATYFVNPGSNSSRALSVRSIDRTDAATCDPNKLEIPELDLPALDRVHRFVRLQRKLGWTARDLDRAIKALRANDLTMPFLKQLSHLRRLKELLRCSLVDLLAFWDDIDTSGYPAVSTPGNTPAKLPSKYEELFRNKALANPLDPAFTENPAGLTGALSDHMPAILSALRLSAADFALLTTGPTSVVPNGTVNLANLSSLFRHAILAHALRLPIRDLLRAKVLFDIDPFATTETSVRFVETVRRTTRAGFDVPTLAYLLRHDLSDSRRQVKDDQQTADILSQLRDGLRKIDQETTAGEDPTGDFTRSKLAQLRWNEAHIAQAIALFGDSTIFSQTLDELPRGLKFPTELASRVSYDRNLQILEVRGVLSEADRKTLRELTADENEVLDNYRDAVDEIFRRSRESARKFLTERMRAFELPPFAAPAPPDRLKLEFALPESLKNRIDFDAETGQLIARLPLSDADTAELIELSTDAGYRVAVRALAALPTLYEPSDLNRFLISATDPLNDPVRTSFTALFDSGMSSADRFRFLLERICRYLRRTMREQFVKQALSEALLLDTASIDVLLTQVLVSPRDNTTKAIDDLLIAEFVGNSGKFLPAQFAPQFELIARLRKAVTLISRWKITAEQLTDIEQLRSSTGWDWNALPTSADGTPASFASFAKLMTSLDLRGAPLGEEAAFRLLRLANNPMTSKSDFIDELAKASGWSVTEIEQLAGTQAPIGSPPSNGLLNLQFPADFRDGSGIARLRYCFGLLKQLGASSSQLAQWAEPDLATPAPAATQWSRSLKNAMALRNAVKAKYDVDTWLKLAKPLTNQLRNRQRDALVAFLLGRRDYGRQEADLYDHFLIDVEMSACMATTRLKQAICSIQLFVQRCLMNLESEVRLTPEQAEQWNTWRRLYRVWEANRKVLLHPENWMEPELRDDKSPFFKEAESELMQDEVTNDKSLQVVRRYLDRLHQVAHLEIVGLCLQRESNNTAEDILHVFGRTYAIPHIYFYRHLRDGVWSPWEKVDVDIEGNHLIPIVWNGQLYLFWPVFTEKSERATEKQRTDNEEADKFLEIKLAWTELKQGQWLPRKLSRNFLKYAKDSSRLFRQEPDTFKFLSRIETGAFGSRIVIDCYGPLVYEELPPPQRQPAPLPDVFLVSADAGQTVAITFTVNGEAPPPDVLEKIEIIARKRSDKSLLFTRKGEKVSIPFLFKEIFGIVWLRTEGTDYYVSQRNFKFRTIQTPPLQPPGWKLAVVDLEPYHTATPVNQADPVPVLRMIPTAARGRFTFDSCNGDLNVAAVGNVTIQPDRLVPPLVGQTHYVDMMVAENNNRAEPFDPFGARKVMLGRTPGTFRVLMRPDGYFLESLSVPFAYQDQRRSYLVDMVNAPNGFWSGGKLRFEPFRHAWTCEFIQTLEAQGITGLLSLDNQTHPDQPSRFEALYDPKAPFIDLDVTGDATRRTPREDVDFRPAGAYSLYNWELFFHLPLLIATQLSKNQRFEEARRWFHFIFDPTTGVEGGRERFWKFKPFYEEARRTPQTISDLIREESAALDRQIAAWQAQPFRPFVIARLRTTSFMRNVVMKYLENLIAWADQLFRRDTIESINEATQLYVLAGRILGKRPESIPPRARPDVHTFATLDPENSNTFLNALVQIESYVFPAAAPASISFSGAVGSLGTMPLFCVPPNDKLLGYWDTVADRLFKIRHCMNIEGVVRELPIFEPPIDPALLVRAAALGVDLDSVLNDLYAPVPHYRFTLMSQKAKELCAEVKALGAALLSALEKRDAEGLALLRSRHELEVLGAVRRVREQHVEEAQNTLAGLLEYQKVVTARQQYYLSRPFLNQFENAHLITSSLSLIPIGMQIAADVTAGILHLIPDTKAGAPTTMGLTYGGSNVGSGIQAFGAAMGSTASMLNAMGSLNATMGGYQRRQDDWTHQADIATRELEQVSKQIAAAQIRQEIAENELANHDLQLENSREVDAYMREKYSNSELYSWMTAQIAGLYFQSYRLAYDVAKRTERAYRHETGIGESNFIQFGYWDSLKKGLLAGERLQLDLARMDSDYLQRNKREYEITRHVSLLALNPIALIELRQNGSCEFTIPEVLFDLDYPGHYFRRIKAVGVTVPCVSGPYTGVSCTVTLLKNSFRRDPNISSGYQKGDDDSRFVDSFGAIQSVVTSSGQNDSGLFETNLRDERYLPFEGAGTISTWRLEMPSEIRQFDYNTISDVILHVRYTARAGGQALRDAAIANLSTQIDEATATGMVRLFSVRHEFPTEWAKFQSVKLSGDIKTAELRLQFREEHYPFWSKGLLQSVSKVEVLAKVIGDAKEIKITSDAAGLGAQAPNGEGKEDKLSTSPIQGLLQGNLHQLKPSGPISPANDPLKLFFNSNSIEDLWLAVSWARGSS